MPTELLNARNNHPTSPASVGGFLKEDENVSSQAKYILVTDASVDEVEAATGIRGNLTPQGVLIENPGPRLEEAYLLGSRFQELFQPRVHCTCKNRGLARISHDLDCPQHVAT